MVKCTDRPAMTIAVDMGRKATKTNKQTNTSAMYFVKYENPLTSKYLKPNIYLTFDSKIILAIIVPNMKLMNTRGVAKQILCSTLTFDANAIAMSVFKPQRGWILLLLFFLLQRLGPAPNVYTPLINK